MNKILCFVGGVAFGAAVAVIVLAPWQLPDKKLVLRCRERVNRFHAMSPTEQADWLRYVQLNNPKAYTRWRATCALNNAFGGVPIALP